MNPIIPFTFPETGQSVRTVTIDGEPWFVVTDVCRILGIGNSSDAARRLHPDDLDTVEVIDSLGRTQRPHAANESGLYDLILDSRKPEARGFRRWITHDVIPSIRKTGRYEAPLSAADESPRIGAATVTWDHAAAVARLQYDLSVDAHGFKELLVSGGILTTRNGIPHRKWEHLFWPSPAGSRWEIHASVLPQLIHFAAKVRRELFLAEQDLQMSLPFPITRIVRGSLEDGAA